MNYELKMLYLPTKSDDRKVLTNKMNNKDTLTVEAVALLKQLISTPRRSREETAAADIMAKAMQDFGLEIQREGNNIWSVCPDYDESKPTLLLNAHIDTVKAVATWTRDPFSPTLEGDRLYGLGSNDDGASLVSLLQVFRVLTDEQRQYNMIYLCSAEEEVSGKNGIEHALTLLPRIDVALVGEPTGMQPAIAEKGLMVLDITAHGKSGHAARNEGDNAILHAIDDINWIRHYHFPDESALLGPVKMSTTIISAGTQHNVIPDECTFTVDVRSNELYSNQQILETLLQNLRSDVKARSTRLSSSRIDIHHPLVQRTIALGLTPFGSPTLSDQALMHFPSMKMGPGQSSRSHTADEFICISEISEAIDLYLEVLRGLEIPRIS